MAPNLLEVSLLLVERSLQLRELRRSCCMGNNFKLNQRCVMNPAQLQLGIVCYSYMDLWSFLCLFFVCLGLAVMYLPLLCVALLCWSLLVLCCFDLFCFSHRHIEKPMRGIQLTPGPLAQSLPTGNRQWARGDR